MESGKFRSDSEQVRGTAVGYQHGERAFPGGNGETWCLRFKGGGLYLFCVCMCYA